MSDWYTGDVRRAVESIGGVVWGPYRLTRGAFCWLQEVKLSGHSQWYFHLEQDDHTARALSENGLLEWLVAHCDGLSIGNHGDGWHVWDYVDGESRELAGKAPSRLAALAAAVRKRIQEGESCPRCRLRIPCKEAKDK